MKKQGYRESTITTNTRIIKSLFRKGANLYDPESIEDVVARQKTWNENTKFSAVNTYSCFLARAQVDEFDGKHICCKRINPTL